MIPTPAAAAADGASAADIQHLENLCRQHAEHIEDNKQLQMTTRKLKHRLEQLQRETSALQTEHARSLLTRSQLEALCRELQAQNRAIKEESVLKSREECEKRRAITAQFQSTLADISSVVADGTKTNARLTEENADIAGKLTQLARQYEQKNQLVADMMEQCDLKTRQSMAELTKVHLEMKKQRTRFAEEKLQLTQELSERRAQHAALEAAGTQLKAELSAHSVRFDELQQNLADSSGMFDTYRADMAKMQKNITRLERESSGWRQKCATNSQALLKMAEQKQADDALLATQRRRMDTLQRLCAALETRAGVAISELGSLESTADIVAPPQETVDSSVQTAVATAAQSTVDPAARTTTDSTSQPATDVVSQSTEDSITQSIVDSVSKLTVNSAPLSSAVQCDTDSAEAVAPAVPLADSADPGNTGDSPPSTLAAGDISDSPLSPATDSDQLMSRSTDNGTGGSSGDGSCGDDGSSRSPSGEGAGLCQTGSGCSERPTGTGQIQVPAAVQTN